GCRPGPFQLFAERARKLITRPRRMLPGTAPRRAVADQGVEALLDVGPRQELDQLPGVVLARRTTEQHQAGAAGDPGAGAVRAGQRHGAPLPFQRRRLALAELADVPWP